MRYELNFDEDKVNDVLVVGGASYDLKGCCDIMNEQQSIINKLREEERLYAQEILRLNELLKQYQSNLDLGGDY